MNNDQQAKKINEFIARADEMKKDGKMDLSSDQDLSIAIMNLISIEEHFIFTGARTRKNEYYDLINNVRSMRRELLGKLIKEYEGEVWCISKHLLAASMRLMEVGTKQLGVDNRKDAYDCFQKSYDLYSLFWGLALKLISGSDVKKIDDDAVNKNDKENGSLMSRLGKLVAKAINCCLE